MSRRQCFTSGVLSSRVSGLAAVLLWAGCSSSSSDGNDGSGPATSPDSPRLEDALFVDLDGNGPDADDVVLVDARESADHCVADSRMADFARPPEGHAVARDARDDLHCRASEDTRVFESVLQREPNRLRSESAQCAGGNFRVVCFRRNEDEVRTANARCGRRNGGMCDERCFPRDAES